MISSPDFNKALYSYVSGELSLEGLLESVEEALILGGSRPQLMRVLEQFEAANELPGPIRIALLRRIRGTEYGEGEPETVVINGDGDEMASGSVDSVHPAGYVVAGRYQIVGLIGEGGMSRIYEARDLSSPGSIDEYVALKIFKKPAANPHAALDVIADEFDKLRGLSHPNIVRLFDRGLDDDRLFFVMEKLPGGTLYARLHGGAADRPTRQQMLDIVAQLTDALVYAHGRSIVHGDLKPGNVLMRGEDVKIIDFSIVGLTAQTVPVALTPLYASPQLLSRQRTEPTDDVYSLACIAYEMLTGRHPRGQEDTAQPDAFPPPADSRLAANQYRAIVHGLEPDRARRTIDAGQFRQEWTAARSEPKNRTVIWAALLIVILALGLYLARGHLWKTGLEAPQTTAGAPPALAPTVQPPAPGTVIRDCATCPTMVVLPAGTLLQGAKDQEPGASSFEKPQHRVTIARPFAMSEDAVTVGQYAEFAAAQGRDMAGCDVYDGNWRVERGADWRRPGFDQTDRHPVVCVSWNDAVAYAEWLSSVSGHRYRLPSSAEWEYAARAASGDVTPWSAATDACKSANVADEAAKHRYPAWTVFACDDGYVNTAPVASFAANAFGLHDMLGNVFAWNQDCWRADYVDAPSDGSPRIDADCSEHELRGGSWFSAPAYIRASYRNHFSSDYRGSTVGFRLVRELTP